MEMLPQVHMWDPVDDLLMRELLLTIICHQLGSQHKSFEPMTRVFGQESQTN